MKSLRKTNRKIEFYDFALPITACSFKKTMISTKHNTETSFKYFLLKIKLPINPGNKTSISQNTDLPIPSTHIQLLFHIFLYAIGQQRKEIHITYYLQIINTHCIRLQGFASCTIRKEKANRFNIIITLP